MKIYHGIGVMSGTSLDGLDLAFCSFTDKAGKWSYQIIKAITITYSEAWKNKLMGLPEKSKDILQRADLELGEYIGTAIRDFIQTEGIQPEFIASHGHTIFHEPEKKITLQIGNGKSILDQCGITVINDFRSSDVALGGQGAPLVPIGDRLLFPDFNYCLNLGGIANISYEENSQRVAFDICPANMVLNQLAEKMGKSYDDKGKKAASGTVISSMLEELERLAYYATKGPRSLGREWVETNIFPILQRYSGHPIENLLASFSEHIARRVANSIHDDSYQRMMLSGGGAYNDHLVERMREHCQTSIHLAEPDVVEFKEAMIFAFLGVLRMREEINVLGSVTGSGHDHSAGTIFLP